MFKKNPQNLFVSLWNAIYKLTNYYCLMYAVLKTTEDSNRTHMYITYLYQM